MTNERANHDWRSTLKRRIRFAAVLLGLWALAIETRLVYLQVFRHGDLLERARRQQMRTIPAEAKRGDIVDRRGHVLATSVDVDSIYAVPSEIDNASDAAGKLCRALGDCKPKEQQAIADRLGQRKAFAYVRRQITIDQSRRVEALNLGGIGFIKESRRFYPNTELASHLLGYVGVDNKGLGGLEHTYDAQIRGKPGAILIQTDARRQVFSRFERPPTAGSTIELTIDEYLQHVAERELHAGVLENRAAGGSAIIMNPRTGEILAMANEPTFNPNVYRNSAEVDRRNRAVQDLYEPGSTFKVVTASAAIDEKVMSVNDPVDATGGQIRIGSRVIRDTGSYGVLSFTDVIVKSSNVGAIKIGFRVGAERLSRYVQRFGFGRAASPDFPGENPGIVWDATKWTESALTSVSMGYQVGVTPLQMVAAVGAVGNGGELIEPRVIRAVYRDNRRYEVRPKVVRRAIGLDTAAALTTILEGVVERGTGKAAQIPGFTIAGKTGTAHKLINGRYSQSDFNASFVGFVPSRDPALAIIVVIDSPHGPQGHYGGPVTAPIFKRIAETSLRYLGIPPTLNPAPPVLVPRRGPSLTVASISESPQPPVVSMAAETVPGTVPDLHGLSAREAIRRLVKVGLTARISGNGFVVSQDPAPGTILEPGGVCRVELNRLSAQLESGAQP
jgi:cell division protein FtsI (penicillin-binding protein 3)